ncbi:MAG: peptidase S8/S53 domain-containing protein [Monoraphidium minutum]|nr:MAG: peptidase S8/S53 domain-containing protein [Monoraphidium minutum]
MRWRRCCPGANTGIGVARVPLLALVAGALLLAPLLSESGTAAAAPADGARQPWIVVWRRGVNGTRLFERLCLSFSAPSDPSAPGGAAGAAAAEPQLGPGAAFAPIWESGASLPVISCLSRFDTLISGFSARMTAKELQALQAALKAQIDYVVGDKPLGLGDELAPAPDSPPSGAGGGGGGGAGGAWQQARRELPEQLHAPWGLDSIDQTSLPLDDTYHYDNMGTSVHVYVLDTGIRSTHREFAFPQPDGSPAPPQPGGPATRVGAGFDAVYDSDKTEDCHGHGSHVAAIIGGLTYGVAKNATLHPIKVLDCNGRAMVSSLLKGLEWVANNHQAPGVVHMSVEGSYSSVVNRAVDQLSRNHNLHVVVSAGNSARDACRVSPGSTPSAVTVAAIDSKLVRWAYGNWGPCVDLFAPGVSILSAVPEDDSSAGLKTGTSMAAPFVTGVVALYMERHPGASTAEVVQKLYASTLRDAISDDPLGYGTLYPSQGDGALPDLSATPNRLLQSRIVEQAAVSPGALRVAPGDDSPRVVSVRLLARPAAAVTISAAAAPAWDGEPLAGVMPAAVTLQPEDWDAAAAAAAGGGGGSGGGAAAAEFVVRPRAISGGSYFIQFDFRRALWGGEAGGRTGRSGDPQLDGALYTARITDDRPESGETAAAPRVVRSLPFQDKGDTSRFGDEYSCQAQDAAPDVIYAITPKTDVQVAISTCGSSFDTKLILATDLTSLATYAGVTHYVVVDGYYHASGEYALSITCSDCPDGAAALVTDAPPPAWALAAPPGGGAGGVVSAAASEEDVVKKPAAPAATRAAPAVGGPGDFFVPSCEPARHLLHAAGMGAEIGAAPLADGAAYCAGGGGGSGGGGNASGAGGGAGADAGTDFATGPGGWQGGDRGCAAPGDTRTDGAQHGVSTPLIFDVDLEQPPAAPEGGGAAGGGAEAPAPAAGE